MLRNMSMIDDESWIYAYETETEQQLTLSTVRIFQDETNPPIIFADEAHSRKCLNNTTKTT